MTSNDYDSSHLVFGSGELKHEDTMKEVQSMIENTNGIWPIDLGEGKPHSMVIFALAFVSKVISTIQTPFRALKT